MDRKDALDRSHGDDDQTRTWSTSSHYGPPDYYAYGNGDFSILHHDAPANPAAARDMRARRGLGESSHHQAFYSAPRQGSYHETWPPEGGMMMPDAPHMMQAPGSYHLGHSQQQPHAMHIPSVPFPSHPSSRPSMQGLPGVHPDEADRALQTLLAAAGLNATSFAGPAPIPIRPPVADPAPHLYHIDPNQEKFLPPSQGVFQYPAHEQPPRTTASLPFMMPSSLPSSMPLTQPQTQPHPAALHTLPSQTPMWAHTYPSSARMPGGVPPSELGLEAPFPGHQDSMSGFRVDHTLPFASPPSSPTAGQQRGSPAPSVASAPAGGGTHSTTGASPDVPSASTAPDNMAASAAGSMFPFRPPADRGKPDSKAPSAAVPGVGWGHPAVTADIAAAAFPYDSLSLPTIPESHHRRGSFSGTLGGGHVSRGGGQGAKHHGGAMFGSPPSAPRLQPHAHDGSFRSNTSASFRSTSTSFRSGFPSFSSDSFHLDPDSHGERPDGRGSAAAAAAAAVAATAPQTVGRGGIDDAHQDHPAHSGAATDMSSLAKALDRAPATVAAVASALSNTSAAFPLGLPSLTKLLCNSSKRGKHAKALAVFAAAPELGLSPDLPLCNAALMAASSAGNADASAMIFSQMVAQGLQPDSVSYRAAVTALVKHEHLKDALKVLLHMLSDRSTHDSTACMAAILAMGRRGVWPLAEQLLLAAFGPRYSLERISAMHPAALSQVPETFHEVFQELCNLNGVQLDVMPPDAPVDTFPDSIAHDHAATHASAPAVVGGDMGDGTTAGSSRALEEFAEASGVDLDETVHAGGPRAPAAAANTTTDSATPGYLKQRRLENSVSVSGSAATSSAEETGVSGRRSPSPPTPSASAANIVATSPMNPADAAAVTGYRPLDVAEVESAPQATSSQARAPRAPAQEAGAARPHGLLHAPLHVHRAVHRAAPAPPEEPDPLARACFNALLLSYSCASPPQFERATEVLVAMIQRSGDVSPDVISFNIVLRMLCASQRLSAVPALLDLSRLARVSLLATSYTTYMAGAAAVAEASLTVSVWTEMISAQIVPDGTAISLYLAALFQLGHYADAIAIFLRISSAPLAPVPDACSICVLFATCLHLYCRPQREAGGPDAHSVTSLVARATSPFPEASFEAACVIVEELARGGCIRAMHVADVARINAAAAATRIGVMQALFTMLAAMQQGDGGPDAAEEHADGGSGYEGLGVPACAGIIVGGVVRRVAEGALDLRGAPLTGAGAPRPPPSATGTVTTDTGLGMTTLTASTTIDA
eukprot:jgi/Ulvmu1/11786/UM008_0200.1